LEDKLPEWVLPRLTQEGDEDRNIPSILEKQLVLFDEYMIEHPDITKKCSNSGTTAILAFQRGTQLWLVCVGDSRALVVDRTSQTVILSTIDHKPLLEEKRIQLAGGTVSRHDVGGGEVIGRVDHDLALSRAFCDTRLKKHPKTHRITSTEGPVIAVPEIYNLNLQSLKKDSDPILVLACDGLFDVFTNEQVTQLILGIPPDRMADHLVKEAIEAQTEDNVTVIALKL
jgi:serine/threonine protein phosphatase PrpC